MKVAAVREETGDIRTMSLEPAAGEMPKWMPGQFGMYGVFGEGEAPLTLAGSPTRGRLECTFRRAGRVTKALYDLEVGDELGWRGPYGNTFPLAGWKGRGVVFVAGGIGLPALRSSIQYVLDKRADYGPITILYGVRTARDLIYRDEIKEWQAAPDTTVILTVDPGGEDADWTGQVGLVPAVLEKAAPKSADSVALICGPPIMVKFTLPALDKLGFAPEAVYTTLENRMKCGVGKCGRCNAGAVYVCKDGPVFTAAELRKMPNDF